MPYKSLEEVPKELITAGLNLAQANEWAEFYDKASAQDKENAGKLAWIMFEKKYKKEGKKWIPKEKENGDSKMSDESQIGDISLFKKEDDIKKLKLIIEKLEKAESLDLVKTIIGDLKTFIPAEITIPEVKPEPIKPVEAVVAPQPIVATPTVTVEAKPTALSDALKLNDELITQLQQASVQIDTLEKINLKLKEEKTLFSDKVVLLEKELSQFQDTIKAEKQSKFNAKLDIVFDKYTTFMGIPESDRETVRKQMSTYSEDMLDKTLKYIDEKAVSQMQNEPAPQTVPSSELNTQEATRKSLAETYHSLKSPKDKTDFIFDVMSGKIK